MSQITPEKQVQNRANRLSNGRFAPGCSGNPKGRPSAGFALSDLIRAELDQPEKNGSEKTKREVLAKTIVERALTGDWRFIKMLIERVEPCRDEDEDTDQTTVDQTLSMSNSSQIRNELHPTSVNEVRKCSKPLTKLRTVRMMILHAMRLHHHRLITTSIGRLSE